MSRNTKIQIGVLIFIVGIAICGLMLGALMLGSTIFYEKSLDSSVQYFLTVGEIMGDKDNYIDKKIRISGVVVGESIEFDEASGKLSFYIADVPANYGIVEKQGGLAIVLEDALNDPGRTRIQVVYSGEKPELLRNMTQAIMTGKLYSDGIFYADEILLQCPSRYEEEIPNQVIK